MNLCETEVVWKIEKSGGNNLTFLKIIGQRHTPTHTPGIYRYI